MLSLTALFRERLPYGETVVLYDPSAWSKEQIEKCVEDAMIEAGYMVMDRGVVADTKRIAIDEIKQNIIYPPAGYDYEYMRFERADGQVNAQRWGCHFYLFPLVENMNGLMPTRISDASTVVFFHGRSDILIAKSFIPIHGLALHMKDTNEKYVQRLENLCSSRRPYRTAFFWIDAVKANERETDQVTQAVAELRVDR